MKNKIFILYLRFLYLGYECFCFIFRPRVRGAYVIVTLNQKILIIQNSYKPGWTLPCGMINRQESEIDGAARELFEEVGISSQTNGLVFLKEYISLEGYKKDHQFFFLLALKKPTNIRLDMREVINYRWVSVDELIEVPLTDSVRSVINDFKSFIFN